MKKINLKQIMDEIKFDESYIFDKKKKLSQDEILKLLSKKEMKNIKNERKS